VNDCVEPEPELGDNDITVGGPSEAFTVSTSAGEITPLKLAVILLVPTPTPVANPPLPMVATVAVPDAQVTDVVRFFVLPSL